MRPVFLCVGVCVCVGAGRHIIYAQLRARRCKRFIRRYQSSFHSITIERGPMPK